MRLASDFKAIQIKNGALAALKPFAQQNSRLWEVTKKEGDRGKNLNNLMERYAHKHEPPRKKCSCRRNPAADKSGSSDVSMPRHQSLLKILSRHVEPVNNSV